MSKTAAGLNHPRIYGYQVLFPQPGCVAYYSPPPTTNLNPSFTDWVQNVLRHAIFLNSLTGIE
jgi:hypothetical protein